MLSRGENAVDEKMYKKTPQIILTKKTLTQIVKPDLFYIAHKRHKK